MRDPIDSATISAALVTSGQPWRAVEFHPAIGSTNDRAKELVAGGSGTGPDPGSGAGGDADGPLWRVVLTDHQTGGHGRLGRVWEVPDRAAVAVSAIVPVESPESAAWLPLLAGLALSRALREVTGQAGHEVTPRLKWPNDVLLADDEDRKVSGILCELVPIGRGGEGHAVVVGTGVNVDQTRDELPVDTATSLTLAGAPDVDRAALVIAYLRALAEALSPAEQEAGKAAYRAACATVGTPVRVHLPTGEIAEGTATGIDPSGALVVATAHGVRTFSAGDVVHVRRRDLGGGGRLA